jgi:hypothetical protein
MKDKIKKYLPDITDEQIADNVWVDVISCYGGMVCSTIQISEILQFVKYQERQFKTDYVFCIE